MRLRGIYLLVITCLAALTAAGEASVDSLVDIPPLIFNGFRGREAAWPEFRVHSPKDFQELKTLAFPDSLTVPSEAQMLYKKQRVLDFLQYSLMTQKPDKIRYLAWTLPPPPELYPNRADPEDFLITELPLSLEDDPMPDMLDDIRHINWLHKFDSAVQFSQAYLSPNWYQGGTNSLTLLINLLWDVKLNEVYHPNLMFNSTLSYKLGLYSTPQDLYHNYGISQDLMQWNMKFGVRARHNWFYSFTTQFKTQFIHNYGENSLERKASFLSPGELNLGLGMTFSTTNKRGNFKFNTSISPISYNLKTCIDRAVSPALFSIPDGKRFYNQIGSNAELTAEWNLTSNISWNSRIFIFTDYQDFQADWEHTLNFSINRFLSTQIYVNLRYDTSSTSTENSWRYWMIKEILSFGFKYAFSTN